MAEIIGSVVTEQQADFEAWRIGVTHDVKERYAEWNRPERFQFWQADTLREAQALESYFVHFKGMQGWSGGELELDRDAYVYIF